MTRPVRASLVFNGFTLGFIAAMAAARWLREDHSSTGFVATLLVIVVPFGFWLAASRALPNRASSWFDLVPGAVQSSPSDCRRCISSRPTSSARS